MCPRRGNDPASGHPRAHQPPLGRGTSPPAWDGRLDAPGQRRRHLPSSAWTRRREVKQGKSGGSVGTTDQGKGKVRSVVRPMGTTAYGGKGQGKGNGREEGRLGQGGRGRSKGGEKPMVTTAYGGKGSKGRAANGDRPVGAASCRQDHHTMASCQNPPPHWYLWFAFFFFLIRSPPPPTGPASGPSRDRPPRGPSHLHPTWGNNLNPATTRSYAEVVRGVAPGSGRPTTASGPPRITRYILLPRAPTHPPQHPSARGALALPCSSTHRTQCAAQHPPWRGAAATQQRTTPATTHTRTRLGWPKGRNTRQGHEGEGRGLVLRSPKEGLSAGTWRRKVVMFPRRGNDPASGHPRAHQPRLGRGTSPPAWDGRLDAPGQRRRHLPSSAWTRRREVKQGKSRGSVGTTVRHQGGYWAVRQVWACSTLPIPGAMVPTSACSPAPALCACRSPPRTSARAPPRLAHATFGHRPRGSMCRRCWVQSLPQPPTHHPHGLSSSPSAVGHSHLTPLDHIVSRILLFNINDVSPCRRPPCRPTRMEAHGKPCHIGPLVSSLLPPHHQCQRNDHRAGQCPLPRCNPHPHPAMPANQCVGKYAHQNWPMW